LYYNANVALITCGMIAASDIKNAERHKETRKMAKRNKKIKWTNKFSREEGYVKAVRKTEGFFENTFNFDEARKYSATEVEAALRTLNEIGESENNEFSVITV